MGNKDYMWNLIFLHKIDQDILHNKVTKGNIKIYDLYNGGIFP